MHEAKAKRMVILDNAGSATFSADRTLFICMNDEAASVLRKRGENTRNFSDYFDPDVRNFEQMHVRYENVILQAMQEAQVPAFLKNKAVFYFAPLLIFEDACRKLLEIEGPETIDIAVESVRHRVLLETFLKK